MPELRVVMYHYVRDLHGTAFPKIKGLPLSEFRHQIAELSSIFEMATLEAAVAFLRGEYHSKRDLCLLSFDDGLRDHFTNVLPVLAERRIPGIFGIITGCVEDNVVAPVHMNHFLTAALEFAEYRRALYQEVENRAPGLLGRVKVDHEAAQRSYPLDTPEMASFKLLVNFLLPAQVRDAAIRGLFLRFLGDEASFARELYMSWNEIRQLQSEGMILAGHTHSHRPLSTLSPAELDNDIDTNRTLLDLRAQSQHLWPFSYPYGKRNSYSAAVIARVRSAGFDCAFGTEADHNLPGCSLFELCRTDCKGVLQELHRSASAEVNR